MWTSLKTFGMSLGRRDPSPSFRILDVLLTLEWRSRPFCCQEILSPKIPCVTTFYTMVFFFFFRYGFNRILIDV